jgi:glycosyltransferase involved in cell wall biosynthesis
VGQAFQPAAGLRPGAPRESAAAARKGCPTPEMRILHLDSGREMRGGQWQVLRLIEGLSAAGIESVLLARAGSPLYERVRAKGWRVEPWGFLRAVAAASHCELIHAHDAHSHTLAVIAKMGRPLVVARRVAFPVRSRWKYRLQARYIAVSEHVKEALLAGGVPADKISVIYDGVPLLDRATGPLILAPDNKGAELASQAASLAGVAIHFSSDLERDLPGASIFVYITHSEGLGSGALLAMSAGVPVIASSIGGLREVITHRVNGLLVENSAQAISAALNELTQDAVFARQLGETARRTIAERFTSDQMVQRTIEVYRQVLS